jgi:hypothetical protein
MRRCDDGNNPQSLGAPYRAARFVPRPRFSKSATRICEPTKGSRSLRFGPSR